MASVIGIDEVGRGCWAGPLLVVAARAKAELPTGLADSKLLNRRRREALAPLIHESCELGEGWVQAAEIDAVGLTAAMRLGVERALLALSASANQAIIMDGHINYCPAEFINVRTIVGADASQPIVSAASIYAKVRRDNYMANVDKRYPGYGFDQHVGYGTKQHLAALRELGVCSQHRQSYRPVRALL